MSDVVQRARLLAEARKRVKAKKIAEQANKDVQVDFDLTWLRSRTHEKQFNFLADQSSFKVAYTSRQSGKTKGISKALVIEPILYQNSTGEPAVFGYVSLTKASARAIIWNDIIRCIADDKLEKYIKSIDNTRNLITYQNGNEFRLFGAKDINDVEKLRGLRIRHIYIDEAQSMKDKILKYMIEEVIGMALIANDGRIAMTGTPNEHCSGYFYRACHNIIEHQEVVDDSLQAWSVHNWNVYDNIYLTQGGKVDIKTFLNKIYGRRGVSENDPIFKREAMGLWIKSLDSLMYRYNSVINSHDFTHYEYQYLYPESILDQDTGERKDLSFKSKRYVLPTRREWHYVLGMDFGFGDDCAWVIYAFNKEDNAVYLCETINYSGIIPSLAAEITKTLDDHYNFYKIVGDSGGIGKSYIEEMKYRFSLHVEPAKKSEKSAFIKLMNDDFRMGKIKADPTCDIVEEWGKNTWEVVGIKEKDGQDNHLSDAALYGWRECRHYALFEEKKMTHTIGSQEYYDQVAEEMEEAEDQEREENKRTEWWEK